MHYSQAERPGAWEGALTQLQPQEASAVPPEGASTTSGEQS